MKVRTGLIGLAATMALAAGAFAAPRESVTYTSVNSNGPNGNAVNGTGGPTSFTGTYMVYKVRVTGTYNQATGADYASEARIQVLPPVGSAFTCGPFTTLGVFTSYDVVDVVVELPGPVVANAGDWNFRFWESFDDGGTGVVDKVWSTVTITLDDEAPPPPPPDQWHETIHGGGDSGELPATAHLTAGSGAINTIVGNASNEVDMFGIDICEPATFSASTDQGATWDSQIFLFKENGAGVVFNDDISAAGTINRQSRITGTHILVPGRYFVAVSSYDRDPADSDGIDMWLDTPFDGERAPDGLGAAGNVSSWIGGFVNAGGNYTITLSGASFTSTGGCGGGCDSADYNNDGDTGTDIDIEAFFACLGGNCCATCPANADFNRDGDTGTDLDIEAFFRVLGGNPC